MRTKSRRFVDIGLSKIVEVSETANRIAPDFEQSTNKPFIFFQRGEVGFDVPEYIQDALDEALITGKTRYPKSGGEPVFKEAVAQHSSETGIKGLSPKNIIATHGGQEALQLVFGLYSGCKVAGFTPCWSCMLDNIWPYNECTFVSIPLIDYEVDFDRVEQTLKEVDLFYFNTPHNPTGKVFSREEVERLVSLCEKYNVLMISDEAYKDIVFEGEHFSPLQTNSMYVYGAFTFSKTYCATGLRMGYGVSHNTGIIDPLISGEYTQTAGVSTPLQYAFAHALTNKERRKQWIDFYVQTLKERRQALIDNLKGIEASSPNGAFYCFIDVNQFLPPIFNIDRDAFILKRLYEHGIAAVPGSAFGKEFEGFLRLSFSTLPANLVEEGAKRLCEVFGTNL